MIRKLLTIGAVGLMLAVSACDNPDDRLARAGGTMSALVL